MTEIDAFSLVTVPVKQLANGKAMGSATAFVWKQGQQHYLITNWWPLGVVNDETRDFLIPVKVQHPMRGPRRFRA